MVEGESTGPSSSPAGCRIVEILPGPARVTAGPFRAAAEPGRNGKHENQVRAARS